MLIMKGIDVSKLNFKKAYFSRLFDATFQILIFLSPEAVAIFAPQGDQHIPNTLPVWALPWKYRDWKIVEFQR